MRLPDALNALISDGIIKEVIRPLQSGKEAQVFIIRYDQELCVAKVYKKSNDRSFKNRASYTEGRRVKSTRQQRAMSKKSNYGKEALEQEWYQSEYQMLKRLSHTDLLIPTCHAFIDNVLIMEFIQDEQGQPAPRLADLSLSAEEAERLLLLLIRQVVIMLCEGVVHGDLSDFNILMAGNRPVIIDFPQAIDTAHNRNSRRFLIRDVRNLTHFMGRFAPHLKRRKYGEEMWALYEAGTLRPDTVLTGKYNPKAKRVDEDSLIREIQSAAKEAAEKREQHMSKYAKKAQRAREVAEAIAKEQKEKRETSDHPKNNGKRRKSNRRKNRRYHKNKKGNTKS